MNIIKLQVGDMPYALALANQVFDFAIRQGTQPGMDKVIGFYRDYARENVIAGQVQNGALHMWGVREGNYLVALSAMTAAGHITMLYVHPQYMRRKYGRKLLYTMRAFAANELGLKKVTVNVMPVWASGFFVKNGFKYLVNDTNGEIIYMPMTADAIPEVRYEKKHVSVKALLWICIGCPVLITLITIAYTLYYLNV